MRWPNSAAPGVQPYNDSVLADLENVLEDVVALADRVGLSGLDALETYEAYAFGDSNEPCQDWFDDLDEILQPHGTPEFDVDDLIYELKELIGSPDDDLYND